MQSLDSTRGDLPLPWPLIYPAMGIVPVARVFLIRNYVLDLKGYVML